MGVNIGPCTDQILGMKMGISLKQVGVNGALAPKAFQEPNRDARPDDAGVSPGHARRGRDTWDERATPLAKRVAQ